jgi:hypothetical protein
MTEETSVIVAESAQDTSSDASLCKTVILSNSADISNTAEIKDDDGAEDEADAVHDHQYHSALQEEVKSEDDAVPEL